jgi:type II secretory pathway pseudopilin PulG
MRRQPHPLAGALRRALFNRVRQTEEGDTLIEVLLTVVILGGCALALITTFGTAISASADYRSLAVNGTVLRNIEQTSFYQLQQQPSPLFTPCATTADYSPGGMHAIQYPTTVVPATYKVSISAVQYWNGTSFGSSCTPGSNDPQQITLTVNNANGSIATTEIAVDGIGVSPPNVTVTSVSPPSASTGTANVLLTVTGTDFESGATVSIPNSGIVIPANTTTYVSPTTLTVFVTLYTGTTPSPATDLPPGSYPVTVTNPAPDHSTGTGALFTIDALTPTGLHVSAMVGNIADPVVDDPDEDAQYGWDAWDTISVESGTGAPLQGVVINGTWSVAPDPGYTLPTLPIGTSTLTCTTDATGTCTVYYGWRDVLHYVTATFTVSTSTSSDPAVGGLVLPSEAYIPGSNSPGSLTISAPTGS